MAGRFCRVLVSLNNKAGLSGSLLQKVSRCSTRALSTQSDWQPELYVFDKYGTLINVHTIWAPWVEKMCNRLESATGLALQEKLYSALDICSFTSRVRLGVVGDGTAWQIKQAIEEVLYSEGLGWRYSQLAVEQCWEECVVSDHDTIEQLKDVRSLFTEIKDRGAKIAVSSSDQENATMDTLEKAKLLDLVDHVTCGMNWYDRHGPDMTDHVAEICQATGVAPQKAVLVGDTVSDMKMGRSSGVALTVGVLSGICSRMDLASHADIITEDVHQAVQKIQSVGLAELKTINQSRKEVKDEARAELVIFDKDGTLLCFHSLWTPWAEDMVSRLEAVTGKKLASKVLSGLGYSMADQKWRPSVFTMGTTRQSKDTIIEILQEEGLKKEVAEEYLHHSWSHSDHSPKNDSVRILDNPVSIFRTLKSQGIKVAVCTSDCRKGTEQFLDELGCSKYVDMIMCGDDPDSVPKPAANNALLMCQKLGVDPAKTVMVGDTTADMMMGRAAKLGATVAVLSGVGDVDHLAPDSDHVVPSISHVLEVVGNKSFA